MCLSTVSYSLQLVHKREVGVCKRIPTFREMSSHLDNSLLIFLFDRLCVMVLSALGNKTIYKTVGRVQP